VPTYAEQQYVFKCTRAVTKMKKKIREQLGAGKTLEDTKKKLVTPSKARRAAKKKRSAAELEAEKYEFDKTKDNTSSSEDEEVDDSTKKIVKRSQEERRLSQCFKKAVTSIEDEEKAIEAYANMNEDEKKEHDTKIEEEK
jgi:hypothetical protein